MDLERELKKYEEKWLIPSFEFLKKKFSQHPLPSHDHFHHKRVWNHARKLIVEISGQGKTITPDFIESLLLASMFHDSGMIKEKGEDHGKAGVEVFEAFLSETGENPSMSQSISDAIENHDNKKYQLSGKLFVDNEIQLLPALNISDDLDALGKIGVYRYIEIYLLRGIPFEDLGLKIIANLSGRYGNFMANCSRFPELIRIHSMRHHSIESFFRFYNLQIRKTEETGVIQNTGPILVAKSIYKEVLKATPSIEQISNNIRNSSDDKYVNDFFDELLKEIHPV
jgi:HD superfamily phosphodiesterase